MRASFVVMFGLAVGCGGSDPPSVSWQLLVEDEPAALLSVWGTRADDVWVTGGRADLAGAPTLLHYDGAWRTVDAGVTGVDLWWAFGVPGSPNIYFGGSGGTILRYDGATFTKMTTPRATGIVFGIWGTADDDLWAVGDGGADGALVWRYDGASWTEAALPPDVPSRVFKVHGQRADDVWIACGDGSVLHWNGSALERVPTGVPSPLFSIVTTPSVAVAVGGVGGAGELVETSGDAWSRAPLASPVPWRGATALGDVIYAVGESGAVARRDATGWARLEQPLTQASFHAAWVDPDGGLWGVGGDFNRAPLTAAGFLTYFGLERPDEVTP